jgi:hypothetical protein
MWPIRYKHCANCGCGPERRAYGSRGYCARCFYQMKKIELAKKATRPITSRGSPISNEQYMRGAYARLSYFRVREEKRSGRSPVDPLDIEHKFATVYYALSFRPRPRNAQGVRRFPLPLRYPRLICWLGTQSMSNQSPPHNPCKQGKIQGNCLKRGRCGIGNGQNQPMQCVLLTDFPGDTNRELLEAKQGNAFAERGKLTRFCKTD